MTKFHEVDGIKYAEGVEPATNGSDPEVAAELQKSVKVRITTMIDEDLYKALKQAAHTYGDGRYQTYLNQMLRDVLMGPIGLGRPLPTSSFEAMRLYQELQGTVCALKDRVDALDSKMPKAARVRKKTGHSGKPAKKANQG